MTGFTAARLKMTFLPIVERELRAASRKGGTYWTRVIAAALAMTLLGSFLLVWSVTNQFFGGTSGQILFGILKWLCFAFACCARLFLTADCLSEEKREGTLGLLFLTDLRGYDVVAGKIIATSLRSVYGLLAVFPVLGLTLMLGGVSGSEFWRTLLALCNGLFFSLAAGLLISAISRDSIKAMSASLLLCAVALGVPPLLDLWRADWDDNKFVAGWTLASPVYAFVVAPQGSGGKFWPALATAHGLGWVWLALASLSLPRSWPQKAAAPQQRRSLAGRSWRFASRKRRVKWLAKNPLVWLAGRDLWLTWCALVVALASAGLAALLYLRMETNNFSGVLSLIHALLVATLCLWVAAQANRFLVEARRNGTLELILCTPVTVAQIVRGQWAALQRMFVAPAAIILVMQVVETALTVRMFARMNAQSATVTAGGAVITHMELYQLLGGVASGAAFVTTLLALGWFGMWMGLTTRKASLGIIKTLAFVAILPLLAWFILEILTSFLLARLRLPFWSDLVVFSVAWLGKDLFLILWSRWKLRTTFRNAAVFGKSPNHRSKPPRIPPNPPSLPRPEQGMVGDCQVLCRSTDTPGPSWSAEQN